MLEGLKELNLEVPFWLLLLVIVINLLVDIITKFGKLKDFGIVCKKKIKDLFTKHLKRKDKRYSKQISKKEYLDWQKELLYKIYGNDIEEFNKKYKELGFEYKKPQPFINVKNNEGDDKKEYREYEYDCPYLMLPKNKFNEYIYPFTKAFDKSEVEYLELDSLVTKKEFNKKYKAFSKQRRFFKLKSTKITFPNNVDYDLKEITLNNELAPFKVKARTGIYKYNVCDSHYLEYELYLFYLKQKKKGNLNVSEYDDELIRSNLKHRFLIHEKIKEKNENILLSGTGRSSLLSVQMMVAVKNMEGRYDILRMRRSPNVDAKAGFLQFIPAGGFSSLISDTDFDIQYSNASLSKAILREFLEECFGEEDFSGRKVVSSESIYSDAVIRRLMTLIRKKDNDTDIYFLGSAMHLADLRHELNFLMVLDDAELGTKMLANEETKNIIDFISYDKLQDLDFWLNYKKNSNIDSKNNKPNDIDLLATASASLWCAVQDSKILENLDDKERVLSKLLKMDFNNKITNFSLKLLLDAELCKNNFGLDEALLATDQEYIDNEEIRSKYYTKCILLNNQNYHLCNQLQNINDDKKEENKRLNLYIKFINKVMQNEKLCQELKYKNVNGVFDLLINKFTNVEYCKRNYNLANPILVKNKVNNEDDYHKSYLKLNNEVYYINNKWC